MLHVAPENVCVRGPKRGRSAAKVSVVGRAEMNLKPNPPSRVACATIAAHNRMCVPCVAFDFPSLDRSARLTINCTFGAGDEQTDGASNFI